MIKCWNDHDSELFAFLCWATGGGVWNGHGILCHWRWAWLRPTSLWDWANVLLMISNFGLQATFGLNWFIVVPVILFGLYSGMKWLRRESTPLYIQTAPWWGATTITGATITGLAIGSATDDFQPRSLIHESRDQPLVIWRGYNVNNEGMLTGAAGLQWDSVEEQAVCCLPSRSDERSQCLEHLQAGICGCGIWGAVSPFNCASGTVLARCLAWGTVLADEAGNCRASDVTIEELWVNRNWDPAPAMLEARYQVPVQELACGSLPPKYQPIGKT